jgi:hypothetical protein
MLSGLNDEKMITIGILISTAFIYLNVNPQVGVAYSIFALVYALVLFSRDSLFKPVQLIAPGQDLIMMCIAGFVVFAGYAFLMSSISPVLNAGSAVGIEGFIRFVQAETNIPVLTSDLLIREAIWGLAIPWIEGMLFLGVVLVFYANLIKTGVRFEKKNLFKIVWVCALVGVTAAMFHISVSQIDPARSVNFEFALITDFVFFSIMAMAVFASTKFRILGGHAGIATMGVANMFHVYLNSAVVLL